MKRINIILSFIVFFSTNIFAQNDWEIPETHKEISAVIDSIDNEMAAYNPEAKYLDGAITMEDGKICFSKNISTKATAEQNFEKLMTFFVKMTKEEGQLEESKVALVNRKKNIIVNHMEEWMVFRSSMFELDKARFIYTLTAECVNSDVILKLFRISYQYEGNDKLGKKTYKAEDWISDKEALNKKKNKLRKTTGKFRRKTIDRKDEIFATIANELK